MKTFIMTSNASFLDNYGAVLHTTVDSKGQRNIIEIGEKCILRNCHIHIRGDDNHVYLAPSVHAANAEIWIEDNENHVRIGTGTNLCGKIHMACIEGTEIDIGENCLCSSDIVIRTGDSHSILNIQGKRINPSESVKIGNHVWVGHRVAIQKGSNIADNCIIGTSAVVTKEFASENTIIAGVPAKVIKTDINWDAIRIPVEE